MQCFNTDELTLIFFSGDEQKKNPRYFTLIKWLISNATVKKVSVIANTAAVTLENLLSPQKQSSYPGKSHLVEVLLALRLLQTKIVSVVPQALKDLLGSLKAQKLK